ncbi:MAG: MotA/TolQ/ExbB proton channel family protein [Cyanobacteriota bacterium]|nr:MotA/TolQ/ExbB proton channel family protein [Cyanobacteriota bacterium]
MDVLREQFITGWYYAVPLLLLSIFSVACSIERALFWQKITRRQEQVVRECLAIYHRNPRAALFKLEQNADLPIARIFMAGLEINDAPPEDFRLSLETALAAEIPLLKRFNTVFDTVITLAPLLGLFGTVTGIITTLGSIELGDIGSTDTQGVGSGIAEALYSTAGGLIVALPTVFIANIFRSLYVRQLSKIQEYGGQLELFHRQYFERRSQGYVPPPTGSQPYPSSLESPKKEPYANPGREF